MSAAIAKEWIVVLSFFLFIAGFTVVEAVWLNHKGWARFGKSLGFSALTNFIGYAVGFFVLFVVVGVIMMMVFDGSLNIFSMKDYGMAAMLILGVLFIPALLIVCKRVFLSYLTIQTGKSAWLYSIASSLLGLTVSLGAPILLGYFLLR
ncbi:MAG: hypothetical protein H0X14_01355 [Acidobacteria bacterium]|nr:hypothetical protein [Acidobacteriota bacterium]